ncbi:FAD binding domain-containing protein [Cladophialophora immunda]|nr:FAD binding domain-containing protein [Cladophialophora immunda]
MYLQSNGQDQTTDVVVVGTGPGGLAAVGSAVQSGADVIAIEAWKDVGGNATWSTGWVAFVDSDLQREQGIHDSVDLFMKDCEKLIEQSGQHFGLEWDPVLGKLYAEESPQLYKILVERGVKFPRLIKRPLQTSVPRLAAVENTEQFARAFERDFAGPQVRTYVNTTAVRLITEGGRVTGVRAQPNNGRPSFNVFAKKGVILATGGYQANPALRRRYQPTVQNAWYPGVPTCRGDGHLMGQAIGGDLINMSMIPGLVAVASALTDEAIAVNARGHRFHDEAGPYQYRVEKLKQQPDHLAHYIFDNGTAVRQKRYVDQMSNVFKADTLEELASLINVPADALRTSVQQWNSFIVSGDKVEPLTKRVDFTRHRIVEAPFYAAKLVFGISLTCGGFRTTASMQVVDVFGKPIPGLFAVGDTAGGFVPTAEMGGTHLGGGFVHGWRAGKAVTKGELSENHHKDGGVFGQSVPQTATLELRIPIITVPTAEQTGDAKARL